MPEVPAQKIDFGGSKNFALSVHAALMRAGLPDVPARLLTAHTALSTGWGRSVDNYRLAGLKASESWRATKPYVVAQSCECRAGYPNNPTSKFKCAPGTGQKCFSMYWRAYDTLDEAVRDLVAVVRQPRYSNAYAMLLAGNTEYFAEVGRAGWYTADPAEVKAGAEKHLATIDGWLDEPVGGIWLPVAIVVGLLWYALA